MALVVSTMLSTIVAMAGLVVSAPLEAQSADLAVATPTSLAPGWTIYSSGFATAPLTAGTGFVVTPFNETNGAIRLAPASALGAYRSIEIEFAPGLAGRTLGLNGFGPTNNTYISGYGPQTVVAADNKATLPLPSEAFSLLYLYGVGIAPVTIRNVTLKTATAVNAVPPSVSPTAVPASVTTVPPPVTPSSSSTSGVVLAAATGFGPGWTIVNNGDWNGVTPTLGTGVTLTPAAEGASNGALRLYSRTVQSAYRSITFAFAPGRDGTAVRAWAYNTSVQVAGYDVTGIVANNTVTIALPAAFDVLYLLQLGTTQLTFTSITVNTQAPSIAPTNVVAAIVPTTDVQVLSRSSFAPGWSINTAWESLPAPSGAGMTITPNSDSQGSARIVAPSLQSAFKTLDIEFDPSVSGKAIRMWAWDNTAQIGGFSSSAVVTNNRASLSLPTVPFKFLYLYFLGSTPITFLNITARTTGSATTSTPSIASIPSMPPATVAVSSFGNAEVDTSGLPAWPTNRACRPVRVWLIGDSLTGGEPSVNEQNSFRYELYRLLSQVDQLPVQFRGSKTTGAPVASDSGFSHSGYGGWKISDLLNGNGDGYSGNVSTWAPSVNADVIVLNIGTNAPTGGADDSAQLRTLVSRLQTLAPNAVIVIGTLPKANYYGADTDPRRAAISAVARDLGAASATDKLLSVDVGAAMTTGVASPMSATDYLDGVHYSINGGVKFANALRLRVNQAVRMVGCR